MERRVTIKMIPTGKEREFIEVEVYYDKGGRNIFSGRSEPRGFWISVSRITKKGFFVKRQLFEGKRYFILEVKRYSDKSMNKAIDMAEEVYPKMVENVYGIDVEN